MEWSWLNEDKTEIVRTETNGGSVMFSVDGTKTNIHQDADLLASGALPHIDPALAQYERLGADKIEADRISREIVPWPQEEIDVAVLKQENEDQLAFQEASASLAFWVDKTEQDVIDLIASTPNTFAGFKANDEKMALALTSIVKILKLLRDTGRLF